MAFLVLHMIDSANYTAQQMTKRVSPTIVSGCLVLKSFGVRGFNLNKPQVSSFVLA